MICIWKGDITTFVDIVKLEAILKNLYIFAARDLRPMISGYIDQWISQHRVASKGTQEEVTSTSSAPLNGLSLNPANEVQNATYDELKDDNTIKGKFRSTLRGLLRKIEDFVEPKPLVDGDSSTRCNMVSVGTQTDNISVLKEGKPVNVAIQADISTNQTQKSPELKRRSLKIESPPVCEMDASTDSNEISQQTQPNVGQTDDDTEQPAQTHQESPTVPDLCIGMTDRNTAESEAYDMHVKQACLRSNTDYCLLDHSQYRDEISPAENPGLASLSAKDTPQGSSSLISPVWNFIAGSTPSRNTDLLNTQKPKSEPEGSEIPLFLAGSMVALFPNIGSPKSEGKAIERPVSIMESKKPTDKPKRKIRVRLPPVPSSFVTIDSDDELGITNSTRVNSNENSVPDKTNTRQTKPAISGFGDNLYFSTPYFTGNSEKALLFDVSDPPILPREPSISPNMSGTTSMSVRSGTVSTDGLASDIPKPSNPSSLTGEKPIASVSTPPLSQKQEPTLQGLEKKWHGLENPQEARWGVDFGQETIAELERRALLDAFKLAGIRKMHC